MLVSIILIIVGLVLLKFCADFLVDGAVAIAKHWKVPVTVIGMTIIAFGTSTPELAICISASISGNTDIAVGNIIGSSVVNILLILGTAAIVRPLKAANNVLKKELPILLLITAAFVIMFLDSFLDGFTENVITRADGIMLVMIFSIFIYYLMGIIRHHRVVNREKDIKEPKLNLPISIIAVIGGIVGVVVGADLVVDGASNIAEILGVSQKIIGLTIVTIGTSLPEIAITISAAWKREASLAIGNIIGTNIFNICIALGLPVAIFGSVSLSSFSMIDCAFMILAVVILWLCSVSKNTISRREGVGFVLLFLVYYALTFLLE